MLLAPRYAEDRIRVVLSIVDEEHAVGLLAEAVLCEEFISAEGVALCDRPHDCVTVCEVGVSHHACTMSADRLGRSTYVVLRSVLARGYCSVTNGLQVRTYRSESDKGEEGDQAEDEQDHFRAGVWAGGSSFNEADK